jgi:hypothetical protein
MISTNFAKVCDNVSPLVTIEFPTGSYEISILSGISGSTIDKNGALVIDGLLPIGVYVFILTYFIGEGDDQIQITEPFYLLSENCVTEPVKSDYLVCIGSGETNVLFKTIPEFSDYEIVNPVGGINVNSDGTINVQTDGIPEEGVSFEITYNGATEVSPVFIRAVECEFPDLLSVSDCPHEPIGIVWINQTGGRQSYWFNSPKTYSIEQNNSEQFINSSNELRYFNRGRVEDMLFVNEEYIPESHLPALTSLKNSIQVWACTNMEDASTYKSIVLDEGSFEIRKTNSRFFSMDFTFRYSKQIKIQRQ